MEQFLMHQRIEELKTQLQKSIGSQQTYQQLAWMLYSDGQLENAQNLIHDAILHFPEDPELLYLDGLLSKKAGSTSNAQRSFSKVMEISSDAPELQVLNHLARMMLDTLSDKGNE